MSDSKNPNEPQMLSDEELAAVAGGTAVWSDAMEEQYKKQFELRKKVGDTAATSLEEFLLELNPNTSMFVEGRRGWLANGSPAGVLFMIDDDGNTHLLPSL